MLRAASGVKDGTADPVGPSQDVSQVQLVHDIHVTQKIRVLLRAGAIGGPDKVIGYWLDVQLAMPIQLTRVRPAARRTPRPWSFPCRHRITSMIRSSDKGSSTSESR